MSGICCQRCLRAPCECPFKPPRPTDRDTAPQPQQGSPEGALAALADFAREKCGHNPLSSKHPLMSVVDYVAALEGLHEPCRDRYACQLCGRRDGMDCMLSDADWERIYALRGKNLLCLWCINTAAEELGIRVQGTAYFAGSKLTPPDEGGGSGLILSMPEDWGYGYVSKIAALEAQLAEAQARLAMAVEALSTLAVSENYGTHRQFVMYLQVSEFARKALVATSSAPAVAEFVERVERRGAAIAKAEGPGERGGPHA